MGALEGTANERGLLTNGTWWLFSTSEQTSCLRGGGHMPFPGEVFLLFICSCLGKFSRNCIDIFILNTLKPKKHSLTLDTRIRLRTESTSKAK